MAEIIPFRPLAEREPRTEVLETIAANDAAFLLPFAMFRLGLAVWMNLWFAPLGLRVEVTEQAN